MAVRATAKRRVPGNPMAGVLREAARSSRRMRRRRRGRAEEEQVDPPIDLPPPERKRTSALQPAPVAAVAVTDPHGRATWRFPVPFASLPVIGALPVWTAPHAGGQVLTVAVEEVTVEAVTVRVWRVTPVSVMPGPGGVSVHLTAVPVGPGGQG